MHVWTADSVFVRRTEHKSLEDHLEPGAVGCGAHRTDEERPGIRQADQAKQDVQAARSLMAEEIGSLT